jgi:DNA-binding GntR family transcriptional regulator
MRAAIDRSPRTLADLNLEFHRAIRESTANPYLERFLRQVEHAVRRFGTTTYNDPTRARESLEEHEEIIDAIAAGDAVRAEQAAIMHMSHARDARIAALVGVIEQLGIRP